MKCCVRSYLSKLNPFHNVKEVLNIQTSKPLKNPSTKSENVQLL